MKKNIKKIIILISVIFTIAILAMASFCAYLYFRPYNVIKERGVSFKYPKGLEIKRDGGGEFNLGYITYEIVVKFKYEYPVKESGISISIPTRDDAQSVTLSQTIAMDTTLKPENYLIPLQEITINGNKGVIVKYRDDRVWPGEPSVPGVDTIIHLESKYKNSPVMINYGENDADPDSLDQAWEMILKTLKY